MAANFWASTHCRHWLFDRKRLDAVRRQNRHPFTDAEALLLDDFFVRLLQSLGKRLGWRQPVIATAVVFFKRFFVYGSLGEFDPRLVVPTALYLAAKVEEMGQIRVESVTEGLRKRLESTAWKLRFPHITSQHVYAYEFHLLKHLQFDLVVYHPYRPLVQYAHDAGVDAVCLQSAWDVVNDSLRCDVCLLYPPFMVALAALYFSCAVHGRLAQVQPWFDALNVDSQEVRVVVRELMDMYRGNCTRSEEAHARQLVQVLYKVERHFASQGAPPSAAPAAAAAAITPSLSSSSLSSASAAPVVLVPQDVTATAVVATIGSASAAAPLTQISQQQQQQQQQQHVAGSSAEPPSKRSRTAAR